MAVAREQEARGGSMDWRGFWNEDHSIYVSARHRALHADLVARGIVALLPPAKPRVLDWGCGEAEDAATVAVRCSRLYLYDSAPRVRENLRARYGVMRRSPCLRTPRSPPLRPARSTSS